MSADSNSFIKRNSWLIAFAVIIVMLYGVYAYGKKKSEYSDFPDNGTDIPAGWTPTPAVQKIITCFNGYGFGVGTLDAEENFFKPLQDLTTGQRRAVYNEYNRKEGTNLIDDIGSDFSGDELARALALFSFIGSN